MKTYKINIKDLLINFSLLVYSLIILIRPYLVKVLGSNTIVSMLLPFAILLLITTIVISSKIRPVSIQYTILCILIVIPYFYNNAYIKDGYLSYLIYYLGTIFFCMLLSFITLEDKNIQFICNIFIIFAVMTSIVTWISFFFPQLYDSIFISALPIEDQSIVRKHFWISNMKMGLTTHYSRNAFYLLVGIISCIIQTLNTKYKKYTILSSIFIVTLLLIGKRGHFLFLLISILSTYLIYSKVSIKKIVSLLKWIVLGIIFILFVIKFIPGTEIIFKRLLNTDGGDISTGRFELYEKVWRLFTDNAYNPLGWGQFTKSTNYYFAGVHNDYLQLYCETGILGFIMIVFSNIYILLKTSVEVRYRNKSGIFVGSLIYQIFFMSYSLTGLPHYDVETYMVYFIFTCFIWNYNMIMEEK